MQIVIDLPDTNITEDIIRSAKWEDGSLFDMALKGAIKNAIILPKGHGKLVDATSIPEEDRDITVKGLTRPGTLAHVGDIDLEEYINNLPTIIGADKSESEV